PEVDGRDPVLLSMSPYMKEIQLQPPELTPSIEAGATSLIVPKGYIHAIAQVRGSGLSQGQYNFLDIKEQQDGYDLIEWLAKQPWCDRNVGMLGESYFAMIQYLVAAQQPPHLKCIALFAGGTDMYRDFVYSGGVFNGSFLSMWGSDTMEQCLWPGSVKGKLPPANLFVDWASHPQDGPYYWERSASTKHDKIKVAMLSMVAPVAPIHTRGQLYFYSRIKAPKKLLVLPPFFPRHNELFGGSKPLNEQIIRWLDYWLKGINTGIMDDPEVAVYDNTTGEWYYEHEYPLSRTKWRKFYLRSNQVGPATEPPYGLLSLEPPANEEPDSYRFPNSRRQILAGMPVLAYATPPLDKDLRVWGPLNAVLYGSSTGRDTVWFVKLGDIEPDGRIHSLTRGHLKASYREVDESRSKLGQPFHPFQNPIPPESNKIYEYQIEMTPIFHTFKAGHKIWVEIAGEDFSYHTKLHTMFISEMVPVPAENTVYHDSTHQSHLLLPVIPDAPIVKPVGPPVSEITWPL
ncbi:MAG: CocE/NonD family hydrolase, partial [Promethearchaeota archaeon]